MKVCTVTHTVPSFGEIPAGSLWEDDSPYVVEADCFADVDDKPKRRRKADDPTPEED